MRGRKREKRYLDAPSKARLRPSILDEPRPQDSTRHEKETAKALGGHCTPASGALPGKKSDVVVPRNKILGRSPERVEAKKTGKKSLSIKVEWLDKIAREAVESGSTPIVALRFEAAEFAQPDWILMERSFFEDLKESAGEGESV